MAFIFFMSQGQGYVVRVRVAEVGHRSQRMVENEGEDVSCA